jgi:hypothetical protein
LLNKSGGAAWNLVNQFLQVLVKDAQSLMALSKHIGDIEIVLAPGACYRLRYAECRIMPSKQ